MDIWFKVNATFTVIEIIVLLCGIEKWTQGKEEHKYLKPVFVNLGSLTLTSWLAYSLVAIWM